MAVEDMPMLAASAYGSTVFQLDEGPVGHTAIMPPRKIARSIGEGAFEDVIRNMQAANKKELPMSIGRRFVQVIVSDPEPLVPLDKCILYKGDPIATDLTDQELYFELNIKEMLEKHNIMRTAVINKNIKDRTEYLEPAKIRDLKMTVVKIADL